jgi:hypothetical protein
MVDNKYNRKGKNQAHFYSFIKQTYSRGGRGGGEGGDRIGEDGRKLVILSEFELLWLGMCNV